MKPLSRREVIRKLRTFGFVGPEQKGRHPFMKKDSHKIHIPGEHRRDVHGSLQQEIIGQAGITQNEWENA